MTAVSTLRSVFPSLFLIFLTGLAWGQKDTGTIVGTVKDPTGAVIAGAKVTVTDVERGQTFTATTSEAGEYVASPLHIGR
jgi:Carboxypeptidase regulatory-like domain